MSIVARIKIACLLRLGLKAKDKAWEPSILSDLPIELLLLITSNLDISDAACLALAHRALAAKLGARIWGLLRTVETSDEQRELFLCRLAQDLPDFWACQSCLRLHLKAPISPFIHFWTNRPSCLAAKYASLIGGHCASGHEDMSAYNLKFPHVSLAMKRHHLGGAHGISTESLALTEVQTYSGEELDLEKITLLSVEPTIILDEMHLRVQTWSIFPVHNPLDSGKFMHYDLCQHWDPTCHAALHKAIIASQTAHDIGDDAPDCEIVYCETCSTEFDVKIRYYDNGSSALVITKWLNVGTASSPMEEKWLRHVSLSAVPAQQEYSDGAPGARTTFERHSALSLELLTDRNENISRTGEFHTFQQFPACRSDFVNWVQTSPTCTIT